MLWLGSMIPAIDSAGITDAGYSAV